MDYAGASAYVYAKASGMLGKAFFGRNAAPLFAVKTLPELWELVFGTSAPLVPEVLLANQIETEAVGRFIRQYTHLIGMYARPSRFLTEMLRRYDVENLKELGASLSLGETKRPRIVDLGKYSALDYRAWPDVKRITRNSPFAWYDHVPAPAERQRLDYRLDLQEFQILWNSVNELPRGVREPLAGFFRTYYSLKNLVWGLRLRVYYSMGREEILDNLFYAGRRPCASDPLCGIVLKVLDKSTDSFSEWQDWQFARFLNPHEDGVIWKLDPQWVEQKIALEGIRRAVQLFHQYPMTDVAPAMFFMLKQQELNCIRTAVESIRLNADVKEAMFAAGVPSGAQ